MTIWPDHDVKCAVTQAFVRYSMLAYLLEQEPSQSTIRDMFHQIEEETGKVAFFERLWDYFYMLLCTYLETVNQFFNLGPEFQYYIHAISNAFKAITPVQGCET